jgi:hypothetical protein
MPPLGRASLWLLLLAAAPLAGQGSDRVTVRLDGRAVLRVGPAAGVDAQARAQRIQRRLAAAGVTRVDVRSVARWPMLPGISIPYR